MPYLNGVVPVIDLFAGPGGLGEGFSSLCWPDGRPRFKVRLSIEKSAFAHQTLTLRAFFRQFASGKVPGKFYDVLRGLATKDDLFGRFPDQAQSAIAEAWHAELGETSDAEVQRRIAAALGATQGTTQGTT